MILRTVPVFDKAELFNGLEKVLNNHQLSHHERCLLIIDAAQYDENDVLKQIYLLDGNPEWCWLFEETPFEQHRDAGPIVVETNLGSELCRYAASKWANDGALVILVTERHQSTALAGIRKSLLVNLETYGPCFLRLYDGRFMGLLNACFPDAVDSLISDGDRLVWAIDDLDNVHWLSAIGSAREVEGLRACQERPLEELLTWVSGWPRCMAVANDSTYTLDEKIKVISSLWSAGYTCPESDVELSRLWQPKELALHEGNGHHQFV